MLTRHAAMVVAAGLTGCMATWSAHDELVEPDRPQGTAEVVVRHTVFFTVLPVLVAVDVVTSPFQFVYIVTHAR